MDWYSTPAVRFGLTLLLGAAPLGASRSFAYEPVSTAVSSTTPEINKIDADPMQSAIDSKQAPTDWSSSVAGTANSQDSSLGHDGKPLTPELMALGEKIRRSLATYLPKHLNARDNSSWEVMHGLIAFGPRTEIFRDGPGGQTVNAMGWLCWGARCQGQPLVVLENDHPHALYGVGLQGHDGQYLAMLAQWRVRPESPMHIGGRDFTVADFIDEEKLTCQSGTELTFKLLALSHYLPSDAQWKSRNGEDWDIPKLLKAEIEAPVHGAACGGSHRLEGIACAVKERAKRGEPINGQWARAAKYIADYQRFTLGNLQNPDGSFSTEWFNYAADRPGDIDRKLQTTGHMLEWLVMSLPDEQLRDPRIIRAVDFLSGLMLANPDKAWSIGPMGHALHAQMVFHERLFNEPALPTVQITAAVPMPIKAKSASALTPPEPECEVRQEMSIMQIQKATAKPSADLSSRNDAKKREAAKLAQSKKQADAAKQALISKQAEAAKQADTTKQTDLEKQTDTFDAAPDTGANTDGCDDSIADGRLRMAMREKLPSLGSANDAANNSTDPPIGTGSDQKGKP